MYCATKVFNINKLYQPQTIQTDITLYPGNLYEFILATCVSCKAHSQHWGLIHEAT
jgi:hypothetical protein